MFISRLPLFLAVATLLALSSVRLVQAHENGKDDLDASSAKEITGEIVDLMCYIDHSAMGEKHAACGSKCIEGGGPVGIVSDGKAYLVVGEHQPINSELASSCGKTITLKGKLTQRGGLALLENAEIVKK